MKGTQLRAQLEDPGFLVFTDPAIPVGRGFYACTTKSRQVARYELYEDLAFRTGWVEHRDGNGRTDCNSWPEFVAELKRSTRGGAVR